MPRIEARTKRPAHVEEATCAGIAHMLKETMARRQLKSEADEVE